MPEIHLYSISQGVYEEAGCALPVSYGMVDTPQGRAFLSESCGRIIFLSLSDDDEKSLSEFQKIWHHSKPCHRPEHCQSIANQVFHSRDPDQAIRLLVLGTDFQIQVWQELTHIEQGTVSTYKDIAERIGQPDAVRAVTNAIAENPIAYLLPCHRVVRSDGSLGGYPWGLESKRSFLAEEGYDLSQLSVA